MKVEIELGDLYKLLPHIFPYGDIIASDPDAAKAYIRVMGVIAQYQDAKCKIVYGGDNKVANIKHLRKTLGVGLKEAKEMVEGTLPIPLFNEEMKKAALKAQLETLSCSFKFEPI